MSGRLSFQVLGGLRAQLDGTELDVGGPRQRRVLAVLALSLGRPIDPDRLVELVWGDDPPSSARGSLQSYVSKLRATLEPGRPTRERPQVLVTRSGGYVLDVDPQAVDLVAFERSVAAGVAALGTGRAADAVAALEPALRSWVPVLPELADVPVVLAAARRAETVRSAAVVTLARARLAVGDSHAAVADLRVAVTEDPRAEELWCLLALGLYRAGRQSDALDAVAQARTVLREECGLDVGPELRRLEADLLAQAPGLHAPPSARSAPAVVAGRPRSACGAMRSHRRATHPACPRPSASGGQLPHAV